MHVRRAACDVTQRRRLERPAKSLLRIAEEVKDALRRIRVAESAEAVELVADDLVDCRKSTEVAHSNTGVVEVPVRQERPVVAVDAARLSDEQRETFGLGRRER